MGAGADGPFHGETWSVICQEASVIPIRPKTAKQLHNIVRGNEIWMENVRIASKNCQVGF